MQCGAGADRPWQCPGQGVAYVRGRAFGKVVGSMRGRSLGGVGPVERCGLWEGRVCGEVVGSVRSGACGEMGGHCVKGGLFGKWDGTFRDLVLG